MVSVPVSLLGLALRTPVGPNAELRVAKPLGAPVLPEGPPIGRKRSRGNLAGEGCFLPLDGQPGGRGRAGRGHAVFRFEISPDLVQFGVRQDPVEEDGLGNLALRCLIVAAETIELELPRLDLGGVGLGPLLHQFRVVFPETGQRARAAADRAGMQMPGRIPRTFSVDAPQPVIGPRIGKPALVVSFHVAERPIPGMTGEDSLAVDRRRVRPARQQKSE